MLEDREVDVKYSDGFRRGADSGRSRDLTADSRLKKTYYGSQGQEERRQPRPDWICDDVSHCCGRYLIVSGLLNDVLGMSVQCYQLGSTDELCSVHST